MGYYLHNFILKNHLFFVDWNYCSDPGKVALFDLNIDEWVIYVWAFMIIPISRAIVDDLEEIWSFYLSLLSINAPPPKKKKKKKKN